MTRARSAKLAGFMFLFYIAVGVTDMIVFGGKAPADGTVANLAHLVLALLACFSALVLGVALYGMTREVDHELAMLALSCRVGEGILGAIGTLSRAEGWNAMNGAIFFAVGSAIFCWLLLRGSRIPAPLAWLGLLASILLVAGLPLQLSGMMHGPATQLMWLPMAAFEVPAGLWLLFKRSDTMEG